MRDCRKTKFFDLHRLRDDLLRHWGRDRALLGLVFGLSVLYAAGLLSHGSFEPTYPELHGLAYANTFEHLMHGDLEIDPAYLAGETYRVDGRRVTYFGILPAFFYGLLSPLTGLYTHDLSRLSMLCMVLLALALVYRTVVKLGLHRGAARGRLFLFLLAVGFSSPLVHVLGPACIYYEAIVWGCAWMVVFFCTLAGWLFDPQPERGRSRAAGLLLGLAVGFAVLSRPSVALSAAVPYGALCTWHLVRLARERRAGAALRALLPGMIACALLAAATLAVNHARWGSPWTFLRYESNEELLADGARRARYLESGAWRLDRFGPAVRYYFKPVRANFRARWPFLRFDRQLEEFDQPGAPVFDYVQDFRMALALHAPMLLWLSLLGAAAIARLAGAEPRWMSLAGLAGGLASLGLLLGMFALALRFTVDLLPVLVFLCLVYLLDRKRRGGQGARRAQRLRMGALVALLACSIWGSTATMLWQKRYARGVPQPVQAALAELLGPDP